MLLSDGMEYSRLPIAQGVTDSSEIGYNPRGERLAQSPNAYKIGKQRRDYERMTDLLRQNGGMSLFELFNMGGFHPNGQAYWYPDSKERM